MYNMTIFDEFEIFSKFLFLEVVTLAYLINSQYTAANVGIFDKVLSAYFTTPTLVISLPGFSTSKPNFPLLVQVPP